MAADSIGRRPLLNRHSHSTMRVLAIDTALEACSAAVLDTGHGGIIASETLVMSRGHAEAIMPLIARVMDLADAEFADLDRIAITTGPGSFTGLRVGISAGRGIALAAGKPAVGLSTLAGFAAPLIAEDDSTHVVAAIDARHDNVYLQVFGTAGRTLVAPRLAPVRDAVRAAMTGPARIVGSAADLLEAAWPKGADQPLLVTQRAAPDINWVARLGAAAAEGYGPPRPLYLRAPDAQPQDTAHLPRR
jgi:tRNA threonylcarbamoyl adenosine modification protein YeaZ